MAEQKNNKDLNDAFESAKEKAKETAFEFAENAKDTFGSSDNEKLLAGIVALLFGAFGIHKFILGYTKEGATLLGVTIAGILLSCFGVGALFVWIPGAIGVVEGIIYLTKSDAEFYRTYQVGKKPWF
ncbi:TM2 domain-containing protein [Tamlana agarivorans]|uniref:TM2 domain-containing protein n=1 Tax=Pseudotamlana agarivorans TaxID=481183 RepID=A0ACC5U6H4_9FLAO|nr:TM2 domain-containing protein [Tamlana agarivorans]MBU2949923.1 TM2 domain-containing protein [Tamlana agarivorans]